MKYRRATLIWGRASRWAFPGTGLDHSDKPSGPNEQGDPGGHRAEFLAVAALIGLVVFGLGVAYL